MFNSYFRVTTLSRGFFCNQLKFPSHSAGGSDIELTGGVFLKHGKVWKWISVCVKGTVTLVDTKQRFPIGLFEG